MAGAGTVLVAGCSSLPFGGRGFTYRRWMADPGPLAADELFVLEYHEPKALSEHGDELDDRVVGPYTGEETTTELTGIDREDVTARVRAGVLRESRPTVWRVDYETEAVVAELEAHGFVDDRIYEGYDVYVAEDDPTYRGRAVALGDGRIVFAERDGDATGTEVAERVIDARQGKVDRYGDADEAMAAFAEECGTGHLVLGTFHEPVEEDDPSTARLEHSVANGVRIDVDDGQAVVRVLFVFDDEEHVDTGTVEDWLASQRDDEVDNWLDELDDATVEQRGIAAVVDVSMPADEFTF